jgi:hypothetical protein
MPQIARLKITLDRVRPQVMRRVEVPVDIRLDDLHLVVQIAMGWDNDHLYEFRIGKRSFGIPDPDLGAYLQEGPDDASGGTLLDIFANGGRKAFTYMYDFGDSWDHSIKVEAVAEAAPDRGYPRLIAAKRACPPEDVGGPWGYAEFLEAIGDPKHERHDELVEWHGPGFDPNTVDETTIHTRLAALAKPLAGKTPAPARSRTKRR